MGEGWFWSGLGFNLLAAGGICGAAVNLDDARQAIGVHRPFIPPNPLDPREAQCVAAGVPFAWLDLVTRDLQHDLRLHDEDPAPALLAGSLHEDLGDRR